MDFDNTAQVDALAKLPAEPVKPAPKWSAWSAPLRAIPAAAAEAMAGAGEVAVAAGRSVIANRDAPRWKGQTQAEREAADRQAQEGVNGQNEFSRTLRDVAEHYAPDPATASTAENVVFQLTRGLGKALGYGLTMGPVGIGLFAADEGLTEADRLQRQGVDAATATQAGVVTGLATGAGAFVPVAPLAKGFTAPNLAKVTGLAAVSGPMTFAAQQQMTRDILAGANYAQIAKRYDPLDPLGLTLSAVAPWAFGAVSLRGGAKAKPAPSKPAEPGQIEPPVAERPPADTQAPTVPPEAVDAAMVQNLTLYGDAARLIGEIEQQKGLSNPERQIEQRFAAQLMRDLPGALEAYARLPDTGGGKIVNTDAARELAPEYAASKDGRSLYARAVHEPASWLAKLVYQRLLAKPPETGKVLMLGGGGGSGKTSALSHLVPGYEKQFDAIYDTTLADPEKARTNIEMALRTGRTVDIYYTARDPGESLINGVIKRAGTDGRTVPLDVAAGAHVAAPQAFLDLVARYQDEPRVRFRIIDNTRGPGQQGFTPELPSFDYNGLVERATTAATQAYENGSITAAAYRGLTGADPAQAARGLRDGASRPDSAGTAARLPPDQAPTGAAGEVITERGLVAPIRYRLAEAGDLITSHSDDLTANPAFPAELQPRDRTRAASVEQIARIENAIHPELLGESVKASDGAPIIGPDAVVESGNARTIALRRAYDAGKADAYRAWLIANADRFGLTPDQVRGMRRPVLVRERTGTIDRAEFARQANESTIAALSPAEQAKSDAARLSDLSGLVASEDGTINAVQSAPFIRRFMQQAVSPTERAGMLQADGRLSSAGQQRLRNAIFAKAYNDPALVAMLSEATDSNVRNILNGLLRAAPDVARVQDLIAAGAREPIDVAGNLVTAVQKFAKLREDGMTVQQFLDQGSLLEAPPAAELQNLLVGLGENARSPRRIAEMVRQLTQAVDDLGDPRQASMFAEKPAAVDVMADAVERMRAVTDDQLTGTEPETVTRDAQAVMRSVAERVKTVEETMPDLRVDDGTSAADYMLRARRDAMDGTDSELGVADVDLVKAAAECALMVGAA